MNVLKYLVRHLGSNTMENDGWVYLGKQSPNIYNKENDLFDLDGNLFRKDSIFERLFKMRKIAIIPIDIFIYSNVYIFVDRDHNHYVIDATTKNRQTCEKYLNNMNKNKVILKYVAKNGNNTSNLIMVSQFKYKKL